MADVIFWLSGLFIVYAYFGYPLCLAAFNKYFKRSAFSLSAEQKSFDVSIIITCRNEERVIAEKMENTLGLAFNGKTVETNKVEIIVASDASDDRTDEIVKSFAARGVRLVPVTDRKGKEYAQSQAIKEARGDILIFTDAKTKLNPGAVDNVCRYFSDPSIGAVSSIDRVEDNEGKSSGEGFYVKYEMWLRRLESSFYSLVGLSGSCFAVRKEVCEAFRTDIPSDFASLLNTISLGLRGILAEDVVCTYKAVKTAQEEFGRKVRTILRGITTFFASTEVLDVQKYGKFTWQIVSHKLCRWLVPFFCVSFALASFALASESEFFALVSLGLVAFAGAALYGWYNLAAAEKIYIKIPLFFVVTNLSIAVAWWKFLTGERSVVWNPTTRQ